MWQRPSRIGPTIGSTADALSLPVVAQPAKAVAATTPAAATKFLIVMISPTQEHIRAEPDAEGIRP